MTRSFSDSLHDILEVSVKAQKFVENVDFDTFEANDEKVFAVIRALEVIGEAGKIVASFNGYPYAPVLIAGKAIDCS